MTTPNARPICHAWQTISFQAPDTSLLEISLCCLQTSVRVVAHPSAPSEMNSCASPLCSILLRIPIWRLMPGIIILTHIATGRPNLSNHFQVFAGRRHFVFEPRCDAGLMVCLSILDIYQQAPLHADPSLDPIAPAGETNPYTWTLSDAVRQPHFKLSSCVHNLVHSCLSVFRPPDQY